MKTLLLKTALIILFFSSLIGDNNKLKINKSINIIPDSKTAEKIAEAIFVANYGDFVLKQKPYKVELVGDSLWVVSGVREKYTPGGVAKIKILKKNCKVLELSHGK